MKENISVKPDKTRLLNLIEDINEGTLQIPIFQRDFVWKPNQMVELFDSIIKGYPIGSLLFWKPGKPFSTKDKIGPYLISKTSTNISYVLDGFQRITTLFSVLSNPKKHSLLEDSKDLKDYLIYYNLKEKEFTYLKSKKDKNVYLIPLYKIVDTFEFLDFLREIEREVKDKSESNILIENAKQVSKLIYDYEVPFVEIRGGDIKSAVQIFSRINSTGTEISEDFMLSALSYNQDTNFLFSDSITEFLNSLNIYNFEELKRDTVLNCIANSKGKIFFDVNIEDLLHPNLETLSKNAYVHIRKAVEFLYINLNVVTPKLLPYPTQLIFISEFFRINPNPESKSITALENWFWTTPYSNYFTLYSLSQQRFAYKYFSDFAKHLNPDGVVKLGNENSFQIANFPEKLNYSSVRSKVLQLFFLKKIGKGQIQTNENYKVQFIFGNKDKTPGNTLLRFDSDFEKDSSKRTVDHFIKNSDTQVLSKYFIDEELVRLYNENKVNEFIRQREFLIMEQEKEFVERMGVDYGIFIF